MFVNSSNKSHVILNPASPPLLEPRIALNEEDPADRQTGRSRHISEAAPQRIDLKVKAGTKGDVLPSQSQMITWIDEESKKEHIGPFAWKRASKSTIRRILVERAAQWGPTKKKGTPQCRTFPVMQRLCTVYIGRLTVLANWLHVLVPGCCMTRATASSHGRHGTLEAGVEAGWRQRAK